MNADTVTQESGDKAPAFDARATARAILRASRVGALGSLRPEDGAPYTSMVAVAANQHGAPLTLISTLAVHTTNILADPRASLLLDRRTDSDPSNDPMTRGRISLTGRLVKTAEAAERERFLRYHPEAAFYADFGDFAFYRLEIDSGHLVAGFGRIVDLSCDDLLDPLDDSADLMAGEAEIVEHMNDDHADAIDLYAQYFADAVGEGFRCAACDPDGLVLARGTETLWVPFPKRITSPNVLRMALKTMAEQARAAD
jgi:putative heme iron utilization protein